MQVIKLALSPGVLVAPLPVFLVLEAEELTALDRYDLLKWF
jgi:hypothetical protein